MCCRQTDVCREDCKNIFVLYIQFALRMVIYQTVTLQGKKPTSVLVMAYGWAREHGHSDVCDSRFFVTLQQVQQISDAVKKEAR